MKKRFCLLRTSMSLFVTLVLAGCANPGQPKAKTADSDVVHISFVGKKLSTDELRTLKKAARRGEGEAAFRLYSYYAFAGANPRLSRKYLKQAIRLEHPPALYLEALLMWINEEHPDIGHVEKLAKQAIELGYKDEKGLLEEVAAARESGVIPRRSNLRLFPEASEKLHAPAKPTKP